MIDVLLSAYLVAPALLVLAAVVYALTRAPDRLQIASVCLFSCALLYTAAAYELVIRGSATPAWGFALGAYALFLYTTMAALAIYFNALAWRVALVAFGVHVAFGLAVSPQALSRGLAGVAALSAFLALGLVGLWATLHRGSRHAVASSSQTEAEPRTGAQPQ
jgi:hypothetical protein